MSRRKWQRLIVGGELSPRLKRAMQDRSGVYAIRRIGDREVLYVGQSHCGKLWRTMLRHFQAPQTFKTIGRGSFAVPSSTAADYEIAFQVTRAGADQCEARIPKSRADAELVWNLETKWIEDLRPTVNRERSGESLEDDSFDFGANVAGDDDDGSIGALVRNPGGRVKASLSPDAAMARSARAIERAIAKLAAAVDLDAREREAASAKIRKAIDRAEATARREGVSTAARESLERLHERRRSAVEAAGEGYRAELDRQARELRDAGRPKLSEYEKAYQAEVREYLQSAKVAPAPAASSSAVAALESAAGLTKLLRAIGGYPFPLKASKGLSVGELERRARISHEIWAKAGQRMPLVAKRAAKAADVFGAELAKAKGEKPSAPLTRREPGRAPSSSPPSRARRARPPADRLPELPLHAELHESGKLHAGGGRELAAYDGLRVGDDVVKKRGGAKNEIGRLVAMWEELKPSYRVRAFVAWRDVNTGEGIETQTIDLDKLIDVREVEPREPRNRPSTSKGTPSKSELHELAQRVLGPGGYVGGARPALGGWTIEATSDMGGDYHSRPIVVGTGLTRAEAYRDLKGALLRGVKPAPRAREWLPEEVLRAVEAGPAHSLAVAAAPFSEEDAAGPIGYGWIRRMPARGRWPDRYVVTQAGSHELGSFRATDSGRQFRDDAEYANEQARIAKATKKPAGYGELETKGKKAGHQLRLFAANPRGSLSELGLLTKLTYATRAGELVTLRWSLKDAPVLAHDEDDRLFIVYGGRVVRGSTDAEIERYERMHWGARARGKVRGGIYAGEPLRELGEGVAIVYTTIKGGDRGRVDYRHEWGDGWREVPEVKKRGKWLAWQDAPKVAIHECGAKGCPAEQAIALVGGNYIVREHGIIG